VRHRKYEHHLHNLRNIKPSIDNRDPRRPKTSNATGARKEAERNNQIMHENTILLNKLSRILTRDPEPVRAPMLVKGLNDNHKKGERERIDRENAALLRRLQDVRPSIDAEAAREHYELHMDLIHRHQQTFTPNPFLNNTAPNPHRRPQSATASASGASAYADTPIDADGDPLESPPPESHADPMAELDELLAGSRMNHS